MTFDYSGSSVTLRGSLYPYKTTFRRLQSVGVSADGGNVAVRDEALEEVFWKIILHETHVNISNIRSFFLSIVGYQKHYFTFTPDSTMDLGAGAGTAQYARLWSSNFLDNMDNFHVYGAEIILRKEIQ
jgi:hypothetical protein